MFKLYLKKRPIEIGLDYHSLAELTENFVSSDIKFLCDEASRQALKQSERITKEILHSTIKKNKPSLSSLDLDKYIQIKNRMEGNSETKDNNRPSIGFKR
jgi:transitional endoplasmic reticulum ATPase